MIVNTRWLLDYLSPHCSLEELLGALPRVGLDVEAVHRLARDLSDVRVGFVRSKKPLPGAEGMYICGVETAKGDLKQIVCASMHPIEEGWGVPVAPAGIDLPTGVPIREEHFHGVLSQGMICLDGEMGMVAEGTGLRVFRDEGLLGKRLIEASPIDEALVHIKVNPNRPDCLGLVGIAREVAAILGLQLVLPQAPLDFPVTGAKIPVEIDNPALCTRYTCRVIAGVRVTKSPAWLASRLMATGLRPINNVVDITNFVMAEWAQPLHAFDLAKVREKVIVRRFHAGESLLLLDGRTVTASAEEAPLAIADSHAPMALAGIMGGEPTSITDDSADVLLEVAHFEPTEIRRSSRRLGVSTDASYRFERGMDPGETLEAARDRATALMFSEAEAKSMGPISDAFPAPPKRTVFTLPAERVSSYLGIEVSKPQVTSSLEKLGYRHSSDAHFEVPTRRVDANDPVVLIEDIARVIGYEAIVPVATRETPTRGASTALDAARQTLRATLVGNGFLEARGVPLERAEGFQTFSQLSGEAILLENPLVVELARMRSSLVPFLVTTAVYNAKRRVGTFRYFEMDKVFSRAGAEPQEHWAIGILLGGALNDADWDTHRNVDFFDLKGMVESALEALAVPKPAFEPTALEGYAPGTAARISVNGAPIGILGQVSPERLAAEKIFQPVFAAELFLAPLVDLAKPTASFEPLPKYPPVFRDLSLVAKKAVPYAAVEQAIRSAAGPLLEKVECMDIFEGKGIAPESRSIAVSMIFRAADRTLASEDVNSQVEQIIQALKTSFGAELRGR